MGRSPGWKTFSRLYCGWGNYFTINKMKAFAIAASCYLTILYVLVQFWTKNILLEQAEESHMNTKCIPSFPSPSIMCFSVHLIHSSLIHSSSHVHFGTECTNFEDPFLRHIPGDLIWSFKCPLSYFITTEHAMNQNPIASWASFASCRCLKMFRKGFLVLLFSICFVLFGHGTIKTYKEMVYISSFWLQLNRDSY